MVLFVQIFFVPYVRADEDPVSITSGTVQYSTQRKLWFASGLYWIFYESSGIKFRTSADGLTWSGATSVENTNDEKFSSWFNGTYISYVRTGYASGQSMVYYRMGTPETNGTITWTTTEQEILNLTGSAEKAYYPFLSVDSSGYPFVTYTNGSGSLYNNRPSVIKSSLNNGTWTTDSGFPFKLATNASLWKTQIVPLTSQQMYAVCGSHNVGLYGRLWNGSAWGSVEEIDVIAFDPFWNDPSFSSVAISDGVHVVYGDNLSRLCYMNRSGNEWNAKTILGTFEHSNPLIQSVPKVSLSKNGTNLYAFFSREDGVGVYFVARINGDWTDVAKWITDSNIESACINSLYEQTSENMGIVYTSDAMYFQKFYYSVSVDPFSISNVNLDFPILNATWSETDRQLIFYTVENIIINLGTWIDSPSQITDNDNAVSWTRSDLDLTLSDLGGLRIVASWEIDIPPQTIVSKDPPYEELEDIVTSIKPPQLSMIGLLFVVGGVGIFGVSALWRKLSRPTRRKPQGVKTPKAPRRRSPRKPKRNKRTGRFV